MNPRIEKPNFTQVPNTLLDALTTFTECELVVIMLICRETFGWQEKKARLTLPDIVKKTGRSHGGIAAAITTLCKRDLLQKVSSPNGNEYSVLVHSIEKGVVQPVDDGSPTSGRPVVQPVDDPNKERKDLKKGKEDAPPKDGCIEVINRWIAEYTKHHDGDIPIVEWGRDGKAINQLLASGITGDQIIRAAVAAWKHPEFWNCKNNSGTILKLKTAFNDIRRELNENLIKKPASASPAQEIRSLETERREKFPQLEAMNEVMGYDCNKTPENIAKRKALRERVQAIDARLAVLRK